MMAGSFGVVATAIFSGKAAIKAEAIINEAEIAKDDDLTGLEKVIVAGPNYISTIVTGGLTISSFWAAHILGLKRQAALASAYILMSGLLTDYQKRLPDRKAIDRDILLEKSKSLELPASSDADLRIFYEEHVGRFFRRTMLEVQDAEYQVNRKFAREGEVTLNDFLAYLSLPPVEHGDVIGWSQEIICDYTTVPWIDFEHELVVLEDGSECYHIHVSETPEPLED